MDQYLERVVDLLDPALNRIHNLTLEEARCRVLSGSPEAVREIDGSFALLARDGKTVRMARSLDRPMRYFLAKRAEGPALIVADRIDAIYRAAQAEGLDRPVSSELHAHGAGALCRGDSTDRLSRSRSRPTPASSRRNATRSPTDLDEIGQRYIGALADEIAKWLRRDSASANRSASASPAASTAARCFSLTYHVMRAARHESRRA